MPPNFLTHLGNYMMTRENSITKMSYTHGLLLDTILWEFLLETRNIIFLFFLVNLKIKCE